MPIKCPECDSTDTLSSTKEVMDKQHRIFHIPCWFCEHCYHEALVAPSDAEAWCDSYYEHLPDDIRPRPKPIRSHVSSATMGLLDD